MTLMAVPVTGVVETIAKVAADDEGTALVLLQLALYEAVCDEADRIRPMVEKRFVQQAARRVDGALEHLAKRYAGADDDERAELEQIAEHLVSISKEVDRAQLHDQLVQQGRLGHHPETGRFTSGGGIRGKILDLLGIATQKPDRGQTDSARSALSGVVGADADAFTRLRALGQTLSATSSQHAQAAGGLAQLAANIGPEAQSALEPGIRRSAYRYRGTERKPSGKLVRQGDALAAATTGRGELPEQLVDELVEAQQEIAAYQAKESQRQGAPGVRAPAAEVLSPLAGALMANPKGKDDKTLLARTSDFGALSLRKQVPDLDTAKISLAAGKMPPSLGLLFDADGRLVSEAQGFNGDHYLPFDLKNLKRLKGGSYVRTRTTGGLTDEDIYTGLLTGARQVTVVSNSGVFTLEFDPSLRGGRRYSDKARQMVERYAALTKVIGSGQLVQRDIDPEEMRTLRRQAHAASGGDPAIAERNLQEALEAKAFEEKYLSVDEDDLMRQADAEARAGNAQALQMGGNKPRGTSNASFQQHRNEIFRRLKAEAQAKQIKTYRLDGEGYGAAMKALQTEFPYFVREQKFTPLQEYLTSRGALDVKEQLPKRGGADIGYTRRGELATYRAQDGTKREKAERTGVRPARHFGGAPSAAVVPAAERTAEQAPSAVPAAGARVRAEQDAPSFEQAAAKAAHDQREILNSNLKELLPVAGAAGFGPPEEQVKAEDHAPLGYGNGHYLAWLATIPDPHALLSGSAFTGQTPKHARDHQRKLREALEEFSAYQFDDAMSQRRFAPEKFARAKTLLDNIGGLQDTFVPPAASPALYRPELDDPKPQAFPEIVQAGASTANLVLAARHAPDGKTVEPLVAQYLELSDLNGEVGAQIRAQVRGIEAAIEWGSGGKKTSDVPDGMTAAQAKHLAAAAAAGRVEDEPEGKALLAQQRAWSFARAWKYALALTNEAEPERFGGAAPFAPPPEPGEPGEAKKRFAPHLVMHSAGSPIAKALAARLR